MRIPETLLRQVVDHCREMVPEEACGVLSGPAGGDPGVCHIMLNNAPPERITLAFEFVPGDQLRLYTELDEAGRRPLVIFHSHTSGMAYPSVGDIDNARYQGDSLHLIIATSRLEPTDPLNRLGGAIRLFRIQGGQAIQEPIELVDTVLDK